MIVQSALLKCYTILWNRDSSVNIPLPPDQYHCLDEAKWRLGGISFRDLQTSRTDELAILTKKNRKWEAINTLIFNK